LQDTVLQACISSLGRDAHETLLAMDTLGKTRWSQGRYSDARVLQEQAVKGLTDLKGQDHEDTLTAMDNLGRTASKSYESVGESEAETLHTGAVEGMKRILGPKHLKTMTAMESVAMLIVQMGGDLHTALALMNDVLQGRREKLGNEHAYTLLAIVQMARIENALGNHQEAEEMVRTRMAIAERNLGKNFIGTLMGRSTLATILVCQAKYEEAEEILLDVIERQKHLSEYRGDFHPDRLSAMMELVECYRLCGKIDESIELCDKTIEGFSKISPREHPLDRKMKEQRRRLAELKDEQERSATE
jgi:tetratricopeptide (TPR) repeat protein